MINKNMLQKVALIKNKNLGGSRGLEVVGGDSCSKGHAFEFYHHTLDGHFSHVFVAKK